ncbi:MAG: type IV secretion system DNA-binding domain-containing protein [Candidatus Moranbacteria bacterium]|nr:type IV secretion system DNA-binding domain-containing protein [Candidatus Moranbacteria bacterium]
MFPFDLNAIFIPAVALLSLAVFTSGAYLMFRSFFLFRAQISRSINTDLEVVRVSRLMIKKEEQVKEGWKEEIGAMEQLLTTLSNVKERKSFFFRFLYDEPSIVLEIAKPAQSEEIFFYIAIPKKFRESVEKQIHAYFPNASLEKVPDYTIFSPVGFTAAAVLTLKNKSALPFKTYETMEVDPLNELSNALSKLKTEEEGAAIQIVLRPAGLQWKSFGRTIAHKMQQGKRLRDVYSPSLARNLSKELRGMMASTSQKEFSQKEREVIQLTPEEQELIKSIERKSNKVGFRVNIRLLSAAATQQKAEEILSHLENAFIQFENSDINHLVVKKRVKAKRIAFNYIFREFSEQDSIILNTEEIASIYHFPISTTETPKIKWLKAGAAPPPPNIPASGILLGYNDYRGMKTDIRLAEDDRRRHLYVVGQTGTGKSAFLQEMAKQDVKSGKGVCFIDPHGDAVADILTAVPKERAEDVIFFDPSDSERPFGLNMLEYDRPEQKTFVINEMINIFDKLYDLKQTGGPMFEQYMRNAMLLVMEDPASGSTLMEIPKVLADEKFRRMKLAKCANPVVSDFWLKEAEKAGGEAALANMVPYITSKLTQFIANDLMRPIIAQQKSTLNFRQIMDEKKILLINLSKGKIGEMNSYLLGMVIVGKILMSALSRVDIPESERGDFYLYIDEFQNVTTDSISQILSEARKYRLNLTMAHQFIGQLREEISKAVFGNVGSICAFRVGPEDAEFLEKQFAPIFTVNDLVNADNYNCFVRLLISNESTKPFNMKTYPPTGGDQEVANHLKELSRLKYGRDAQIVNREILERIKLANTPGENEHLPAL